MAYQEEVRPAPSPASSQADSDDAMCSAAAATSTAPGAATSHFLATPRPEEVMRNEDHESHSIPMGIKSRLGRLAAGLDHLGFPDAIHEFRGFVKNHMTCSFTRSCSSENRQYRKCSHLARRACGPQRFFAPQGIPLTPTAIAPSDSDSEDAPPPMIPRRLETMGEVSRQRRGLDGQWFVTLDRALDV